MCRTPRPPARQPLLALLADQLTGERARVCGALHGPLLALPADQLTGERARVCGALRAPCSPY